MQSLPAQSTACTFFNTPRPQGQVLQASSCHTYTPTPTKGLKALISSVVFIGTHLVESSSPVADLDDLLQPIEFPGFTHFGNLVKIGQSGLDAVDPALQEIHQVMFPW